MVETRLVRVLLRIASLAVLGFIYLPIVVLAIYAFNTSRLQAWPPAGFTLQWFVEAANNPTVLRAVGNSLIAASVATAFALILGTLAALAVSRYDFFGKQSISFFLVLPIALPGVISGIALRTTFTTFGVDLGLLTIIIGHATFCVVVVYNNVLARLRRLPRTPEEASADLGADAFTTFRRITLPGMFTALLSGGLLAFGLSFDEVIVTIFTAGAGTQTVPMWIYSAIQRPNELPVVNVVALVLIIISVVPVYISTRLAGDVTRSAGL
jgi:putative spermidine/putrescine transport system permease protein